MKINEIIRQKRRERGFTQGELAGWLNIRRETLSDFERGKTSIGSDTLDSIFGILNLGLYDIKHPGVEEVNPEFGVIIHPLNLRTGKYNIDVERAN